MAPENAATRLQDCGRFHTDDGSTVGCHHAPYRIIRWDVPVDDVPHTLRLSGRVVHVAARSHDTVTIWTLDTGPVLVNRTFQVVGTGQPFPRDWKHVGTALAADGALVWHLMELP